MKHNGNLTFDVNGTGELQNVYIERVSTLPAFAAQQLGRIVFNTTNGLFYFNNGSTWSPLATGGNATSILSELNALESSIGATISSDGTWNASALSGANYISSATSITTALQELDTAILNAPRTLASLTDIVLTTPSGGQSLVFDSTVSKFVNKSTYFLYQSSAAAVTHTVNHGLGQKYCNVTVADSSDNVIIPKGIQYVSPTQLIVSFTSSVNCTVIVTGVFTG